MVHDPSKISERLDYQESMEDTTRNVQAGTARQKLDLGQESKAFHSPTQLGRQLTALYRFLQRNLVSADYR